MTYNGNGNDGGTVPIDEKAYPEAYTVTVIGNTGGLAKDGYVFVGWNSAADGSGSSLNMGNTFTLTDNVTLFAQWEAQEPVARSEPQARANPSLANLSPADDIYHAAPSLSTLVATFSEPITLTGTGTVTVTDLDDGTDTETFTLPDARVSANGNDLSIEMDGELELNTRYSVRISSNAVTDFSGIDDDTTWNFRTVKTLLDVVIATIGLQDARPHMDLQTSVDTVFNHAINVDEAIRIASYGEIGLKLIQAVALEYDDITVSEANDNGGGGYLRPMAQGDVSTARFQLFVLPSEVIGSSGGAASIGGTWSTYKTFNYDVVLHELGHCLGGQHSFQDPGCVLGWAPVNYAAEKKALFGWLDNDNFPASPQSVVDVTSTTDLNLVPLSTHPEIIPGTRMARVFRPDGSRFNISYRVSSPPYSSLSSDIYSEKVSVRYDVNNTLTFEQATLAAGESHTNGFFRVICQSVATDGSSADVRIEFVEPSMNFTPTTAIVAEGADGATTTVAATVTLSHDYTETVTVQHALAASAGTAQSGVDYNYTPGTITFAPGETSQSFTFEVLDNALTDGDRTVIFEISPDTKVVAGTELNLTYTILDDEGNVAPVWDSSPLVEINGAKDEAYTSSLADHASDSNNDALTFAKVDGPNWLTVGSDGSLSGTPGATDTGLNTFTVSVSDRIAAQVEVSLEIPVDANATPRFNADSFSAQTAAVPGERFTSTIALSATDVNGDPLTYAKVDGPDWLSVAADGSLSGTPSNGDVGVNTFTVSVTDGIIASPVEATFTLTVIDRATGVTVTQSDVIVYSSGNRIVYAPVDILNSNSVLVAAIYAQGTIEEETLRFGNGGGIGSGDIAPDWVTEDADGRFYMAYWLNPPTDSGLAIRTTNNASGTSSITYLTAIWELANVDLASAVVKSENSDSITTTADNQFIVAGAGLNGNFAITAVAGSTLNLPLRFDSVTLASLGIGGGGGTLSGGDTMTGSAGTYNVGFEGQDFETQGYGPIALAFSPGGTPLSHSVTYDGNGSDGGTVPDDPSDPYVNGATVTVLDNTGNLFRTGYSFDGWNTAADGSGTGYAPGATFDILTATTLYAQWLGTPYTLSFDANGGDTPVPASKTVNLGSAYGSLATTSRTGYTFDGWFTAASGGSEVTAATTVSTEADHTLFARWTINPYTITFDSAGGSAVDPITQDYGTAVSAPTDPTRGGYVFTGWSPALPAAMPAGDLTVTAQWAFGTPQVSVSASDVAASETGPDTGSWTLTRAGDTAPALDVYFSLGGTATLTDDYTLDATSPVTIPAGESSVTVTLTPVDDAEVEGGEETALLTIDGNAAYSIGTASDTIIIGDNEPVTLVYDGNGSDGGTPPTDGSSPYAPGSTVTVLGQGSLSRSGYNFAGWNTAADGSGTSYAANESFTITGNLTLYARWRAPASIAWITKQAAINSEWQTMLEAAGHSVTHFGTSYATLDATEAATLNAYDLVIAAGDADLGTGWERVSVPMINLNPYRMDSLGWSSTDGSLTSQGTSVSVLDASDPIWMGMSLSNGDSVQLWTSNVRFNGNALGNLLGSPSPIASKAGYSDDVGIVRWGIGALPDGEGPRMQWRSPASGDLDAFTLTAAGQTAFLNAIDDFIRPVPPAATYTVTYDGNGSEAGDVPADGSAYASGATVTVLGNTGSLTKSGYSFNNWNTDTGGNGTAYAAADTFTITENTTLYAQWTANSAEFTLTVVAGSGGASVTGAGTKDPSSAPYPITATAAAGYSFGNWSVTAGSATFADANSASTTVTASADATVQANFTPETYLVTYDGNTADAGTPPEAQTKIYDEDLTLATNTGGLTRAGYNLIGWNTAADGNGTGYALGGTYSNNEGVLLYAHWQAETTALEIAQLSPADEETGVATDAVLLATFNQPIALKNGGTITITDLTDGSSTLVITLPDARVTSPNGDDLSIDPGVDLDFLTDYEVTIDGSAVEDLAPTPNAYAGTLPGEWTFRTAPAGASIAWVTDQASIDSGWKNLLEGAGHSVTLVDVVDRRVNTTDERNALNSYDIVIGSPDFRPLASDWDKVDVPMIMMNGYYMDAIGWFSNEGSLTLQVQSLNVADAGDPVWRGMNPSNGDSVTIWSSNCRVNDGPTLNNDGTVILGTGGAVGIARWSAGTVGNGPRMYFGHTPVSAEGDAMRLTADGQTAFLNAIDDFISSEASYTVTYDGNGSDGGSVPVDGSSPYTDGATVTVLGAGSLTRTGYMFTAWNTASDGTGTNYVADNTVTISDDLTLHAQWTPTTFDTWIAQQGLDPADIGFEDDPDADGLSNGLEAFFGTDASRPSRAGVSQITMGQGSVSFQHPNPDSPLGNVSGTYQWSLDLATWYDADGVEGDGSTTMTALVRPNDPEANTTTVDCTFDGTIPNGAFLRIWVSSP